MALRRSHRRNRRYALQSVYANRFGSPRHAYQLIGYDPGVDFSFLEDNKRLRALYQVVEGIIRQIGEFGGEVRRDVTHDFLVVNEEIKVSVVICRCAMTAGGGSQRWRIKFDASHMPDITIAVRMDQLGKAILDYYVIPPSTWKTRSCA